MNPLDTHIPTGQTAPTPSAGLLVAALSDQPVVGELVADTLRTHLPGVRTLVADLVDGPMTAELNGVDLCICVGEDADRLIDTVARVTLMRPDRPVIAVVPRHQVSDDSRASVIRRAVGAGAADVLIHTQDYLDQLPAAVRKVQALRDELGPRWHASRATSLQAALEGIQAENRTLRELIERFEAMAMSDPLTGLANRRGLESRLSEMFSSAKRYGSELSCLMIDVDRLKVVNDALGHAGGDELLRLVGAAIAKECRRSDFAGRLGGDEFLVLMPHTPAAAGRMLASRIQQTLKLQSRTIASRLGILGRGLGVTVGISSTANPSVRTQADLLNAADDALYLGKNQQRGMVVVATAPARTAKAG